MSISAKTKKAFLSCAVLTGVAMLFSNTAFATGGKGVTWGRVSHNSTLGIDRVGCSVPAGGLNSGVCEAYVGDTSCTKLLPVLCINVDGSTRPNYPLAPVIGTMPSEFYNGWARGQIATTLPVSGNALGSANGSNALCKASFGDGWRMVEFHDGKYTPGMAYDIKYGDTYSWHSSSTWPSSFSNGGWWFYAYGNVRNDTRFWVWVNDQSSNCWNP